MSSPTIGAGASRSSLDPSAVAEAAAALREANLAFASRYPGESDARQPVHTLIEGAQHFSFDVAARCGEQALRGARAVRAGREQRLAAHSGYRVIPRSTRSTRRVREKLEREPVEDYRIDFEDGYGVHSNADEDHQVGVVAAEIARGMRERTLPPSIGLRIKPLTEELRERSVRTLDLAHHRAGRRRRHCRPIG